MARVLVVDDDAHIREVVRFALTRGGHDVVEAADGAAALAICAAEPVDSIDLVVLDIIMPELDGLEVARRLLAARDLPILFLTSRDDEFDRVLGLELGADDYVTKPFSPRELVARVKAVLRRVGRAAAPAAPSVVGAGRLTCGALSLDRERHRVTWDGREVALTATEFELVAVLMARPGRVFTRAELVDRALDAEFVTERTIDSHVRRIRRKLEGVGAPGAAVETVYGVGYRLREP